MIARSVTSGVPAATRARPSARIAGIAAAPGPSTSPQAAPTPPLAGAPYVAPALPVRPAVAVSSESVDAVATDVRSERLRTWWSERVHSCGDHPPDVESVRSQRLRTWWLSGRWQPSRRSPGALAGPPNAVVPRG